MTLSALLLSCKESTADGSFSTHTSNKAMNSRHCISTSVQDSSAPKLSNCFTSGCVNTAPVLASMPSSPYKLHDLFN